MSLPKWLQSALGTPVRGRGCRAVKCLVCRADVIAGPDEDVCASPAICDPTPLSPLGEALALIDGRRSYRLERLGDGQMLTVRMAVSIRAHPASQETIVLADHKCHSSKFPGIEITRKPAKAPTEAVSSSQLPPF